MADPKKVNIKKLSEEEKTALKKERKKLRNEITHKLRFTVLDRDNYTCQYCGAKRGGTMENGEETKLVVDHVVPLDKGGDNDLNNLVTSCWLCNEGKKERLLVQHGFKREYDLPVEKIKEIGEKSDKEDFREFLLDESNEESRLYLHDLYTQKDEQKCIKDCASCINNGMPFYIDCFTRLYTKAVKGVDDYKGMTDSGRGKIDPENFLKEQPALQCNTCYVSRRCPMYKIGSMCAFDFKPKDMEDPITSIKGLLKIQQERVSRGHFFEQLDGGALDKNLSSEMNLAGSLSKLLSNLNNPTARISIEAEGSGKEGTDVVDGLLKSLFSKKEDHKEIEPAKDVEEAEIIEDKEEIKKLEENKDNKDIEELFSNKKESVKNKK